MQKDVEEVARPGCVLPAFCRREVDKSGCRLSAQGVSEVENLKDFCTSNFHVLFSLGGCLPVDEDDAPVPHSDTRTG